MMATIRKLLSNPFVVMWLVVAMYVVKAVVKIGIGEHINSPMIAGDGFHNVADILEAFAVIAVIWVARRPASDDYPYGKKNIEFFTSLAIGVALLVLGAQFALKSFSGLLALAPELDHAVRQFVPLPAHEPLIMSASTFPWVVAVTLGSCLLSLVVSRYQIAIGKATGHASLVADGEETASDGRIEVLTLLGVLFEYFFRAPWLEYPLGLLVAAVIAHTGWELFIGAARVLLQHSIGAEHETAIRERCLGVLGVKTVESLKTFQVGQVAVVMVTVTTEHSADTVNHIKYGLEHQLRTYLLGGDFKECELHLKFQKPSPKRHRIAYAVTHGGDWFAVARNVAEATHILICDVEHGTVVRTRRENKPENLAEFIKRKRVLRLYVFNEAPETVAGITFATSSSFEPRLLGLA